MVKKSINSINSHIKTTIDNKYNEIVNQIMLDYNISFQKRYIMIIIN